MKSITVIFENDEFEALTQAKGDSRSWRIFILSLLEDRFAINELAETFIEGNVVIRGNLRVEGDIDDE